MSLWEMAALAAAAFGAALGAGGLLNPGWVSKLVRLAPIDGSKEGRSELRATLGGLFLAGHGLTALWLAVGAAEAVVAAFVIGVCWGGACLGRITSIVLDRTFTPLNAFNVAFEGVFALLLAGPWLVETFGG